MTETRCNVRDHLSTVYLPNYRDKERTLRDTVLTQKLTQQLKVFKKEKGGHPEGHVIPLQLSQP